MIPKSLTASVILALLMGSTSCGSVTPQEAPLNSFIVNVDGSTQTMSVIDMDVYVQSSATGIALEGRNEDFDIVLAIVNANCVASFPTVIPIQTMDFVIDTTLPATIINWTSLKGTVEEIYSNPQSAGTGNVTLTEWNADETILRGEFSTVQIRNDMATTVSLTGVFNVKLGQNPFLSVPVD